jgi:hypothetical protein
MFKFRKLENNSVLTRIIDKNIFNALAEGKTIIVKAMGKEEKIDGIKSYAENGPHIKHEGWENFIKVEFSPCENQNLKEIKPLEVLLSKIILNGIKKDTYYSNAIEIFDQDQVRELGKYAPKQLIKMVIKPLEMEVL